MPKKSNTKRADGRYSVRVYIGMVDDKKKYKYAYGKTQKEANQKAEEIKASLRKGVDVTSANDSFDVWADYWLASKKNEVSVDRYNALVTRTKLWKDVFSSIKINQIKPFMVQSTLFSIAEKSPYTGKPMAKNTVRSYIQIITAIFDFAVDNRIIEYNPAMKLKAPQGASQEHRRALSPEERERVIEFEHRAKPSAMLMMFSGLRRGEATALQWTDIDFENCTISVTKSYNFKQKEFKKPKNGKSRLVTVPKLLIDYLASLPRVSTFVLTSASGAMMSDTAWKRLYDSYMSDMNLKYGNFVSMPNKFAPTKVPMLIDTFTPHELRHTFCTIMYEAGIDVLVAQQQMGHSDVKTTLSIYTHLDAKHKQADLEKLNNFLNTNEKVKKSV